MKYFVVIASLCLMTSYAEAQLNAPTNLVISNEDTTSFLITFDDIADAVQYEVIITSMHDDADDLTLEVEENMATIVGRRSNTNYRVGVRGVDAHGVVGVTASIIARTTPSGSRILQTITTSSFITVFLEEIPGATGWEIEYNNTVSGESFVLTMPDDTPSNTFYVGLIRSLDPNTNYSLRARVSQLNFAKSYTRDQSPFGDAIIATTDRLSAFGMVVLRKRNFTTVPEDETDDFKLEIAAELEPVFRRAANDNTLSVSVIRLTRSPSGLFLACHVEILLPDQSLPPDISRLILNDASYESDVRFNISDTSEYIFTEDFSLGFEIPSCEITRNENLFWTLYSNFALSPSVNIEEFDDDGQISTPQRFSFSDTEIVHLSNFGNDSVFNLSRNTVYGIRQNYLLFTCPVADTTSPGFYDRRNGAFSKLTTPESNRYSIFYTTDLTSFPNDTILYETTSDGRGAVLNIPANLVKRVISYDIIFNNSVLAMLTERELDGSSIYTVAIENLNEATENTISIQATVRKHDNTSSSAITQLNVETDINECVSTASPHNCHANASCTNTIGSFFCSCLDGFEGDGLNCSDIDECSVENQCPGANCTNTVGGFECVCTSGFFWNESTCVDIDECATGDPCPRANCTNMVGSFECACSTGFRWNGSSCIDIDECTTDDPCTGANCTNNVGSFECICNSGLFWNESICMDINECTTDNPCTGANCINIVGGFECECTSGLFWNGTTCMDIDECTTDDACAGANCTNTVGSFECICNSGLFWNESICMDINECTTDNPCTGANCINIVGGFECECTSGLFWNGTTCVDIDECTTGDACTGANCTNTEGSFLCICADGFSWNDSKCMDIDECQMFGTCHSNASCVNTNGSFTCSCLGGFTGNGITSCADIDECNGPANLNNCNDNAECINEVGSFRCSCLEGFVRDGLQCIDRNECTDVNLHNCDDNADCINEIGTFSCVCKNGFFNNGSRCDDVNECLNSSLNNCSSNLMCRNLPGSFTCEGGVIMTGSNIVVWIALGIIVLLIILFIGAIIMYWRRTKPKKGEYDLEDARLRYKREVARKQEEASKEFSNAAFDGKSESPFRCVYVVNPEGNEKIGISNGKLKESDFVDPIPLNALAQNEVTSQLNKAQNGELKNNDLPSQNGGVMSNDNPIDSTRLKEISLDFPDAECNNESESPFRYTYVVNPDPEDKTEITEKDQSDIVDPLPLDTSSLSGDTSPSTTDSN